MMWAEAIVEELKAGGIEYIAYVPDAVLQHVLERMEKDPFFRLIPTAREEEGIGVISGAYLGGKRGAMLLQSSGLGNSVNTLASLNVPHQIPLLILVSQRGELEEFNICQVPMGRAVRPIFDALGILHFTLQREEEIRKRVQGAIFSAYSTRLPVALILSTLLTGGKRG
ncbi:MAG: sulfopyruvate decarboxylase subunit alpha [Nitrospinota bacterium]|nr:MAG: sulfopyruvate decarboxylase subunit alpha [Nitrospinota bacterium]